MLAELKAQLILTYNMGARVNNTAAKAPDDVLKPLQSAQGKLPAPGVFPLTLEERNTVRARAATPAVLAIPAVRATPGCFLLVCSLSSTRQHL